MSAIHKLLPVCALGLALAMGTGCAQEAAHTVQPDIEESTLEIALMRSDRMDTDRPSRGRTPLQPKATPSPDSAQARTPDFSAQIRQKQEINGDVVGWIYVPGTNINNEVLKNPQGESNAYYLNRDIYGQADRNGTYCTDLRATFGPGGRADLVRNTTVYGHSWSDNPNGELFAQLKKYRDPDFARNHPYIYFSSESENMVWEVFAVFDTHVSLPYINPTLSSGRFFDMLELVYDASLYSYPTVIGPDDKILTLSTCTYSVVGHRSLGVGNDYRFAIMARLVEPEETLKSTALFAVNDAPLSPDGIYYKVQSGAIPKYKWVRA